MNEPFLPHEPCAGRWYHTGWKAAAVLAAALIAAVVIPGLVVLLARPLAMFFLAFCIAAGLSPLIDRLATRMARGLAVLLTYGVLLLLLAALITLLAQPFLEQLRALREQLPSLLERLRETLNDVNLTDDQIGSLASQITSAIPAILAAPLRIASGLLEALVVLIVSLYLLLDGPRIHAALLLLLPEERRAPLVALNREVLWVAGGYLRGVAISVVVVATLTSLALSLIGVPFALVLGVIAGLFEALPTIGSFLAAVPILVIAFLESPATGFLTLGVVLIIQQVQGNVISPMVMQSQANVPRYLVPLAVLAGASTGGMVGALMAVPLIAVLRVLVLRVVFPFIRQQTGADRPLAEAV